MTIIRAVVVAPSVPGRLTLKEVNAPSSLPSEALVRVAAVSLNRGEVRRSTNAEASWRPAWNLVGTIKRAVTDGVGPLAGILTR
jgi:NADPH:quinone reductase-like Zn-dependent oxidoreductase